MESIDSKADGDFFAHAKLKIDVCQDALQRLQDMDAVESRSANFCQNLCSHFNKLPASYARIVKFDGYKDVLKHIKLLDLAKSPANRPAINVRQVEVHPCDEETNRPRQMLHEITCASNTNPMLLSHFINVLASMDLTVKEFFVLSTTDGYSLLVFVVTGVPQRLEKPDPLCKALRKEFLKANQVIGLRKTGPLQLNEDAEFQPINQSEWQWWHVGKMLYYGGMALLALYCAGVGIAMMHGKRPGFLFAKDCDNSFLGVLFLLFLLKYFVLSRIDTFLFAFVKILCLSRIHLSVHSTGNSVEFIAGG